MRKVLRLFIAGLWVASALSLSAGIFGSASFPTAATFPASASINSTVASVVVKGAGESGVNGTYSVSGTISGKPYYERIGKPYYKINWDAVFGWVVKNESNSKRYHTEVTDNDDYPWLSNSWQLMDSGVALPVPTFDAGRYPGYPYTTEPTQPLPVYDGITNTQKLSLPPDSPVGTRASVSDAFYLHESNYGDVSYYTNGTAPSGGTAPAIEKYSPANRPDLDDITWRWNNANDATQGGAWGDAGGNYAGLGDGSVTHFWSTPIQTIDHTYTLTHPAIQQLNAPSTALTVVFVDSAGTAGANGIYTDRGTANGKKYYNLLGQPDNTAANSIFWDGSAWFLTDFGDVGNLYTSTSNTTYPWQATWTVADGDSPAPTFESIEHGELDAGVIISGAGTSEINVVMLVSYAVGSLPAYDRLGFFGNGQLQFSSSQWLITANDNNTLLYHSTNGAHAAYPFESLTYSAIDGALPVPTVTRNDVAAEANWQAIP